MSKGSAYDIAPALSDHTQDAHRVHAEMREPSPRRQSLPIEKEATELPIAGLGTVLISVRSIYIEF